MMVPKAFKLHITAPMRIECEFWTENDGWIGMARELAVTVQAGTFEAVKLKMQDALVEQLGVLLGIRHEAYQNKKIA